MLQSILQSSYASYVILEWLVLCAFHLKITFMITLVFPAIVNVFSVDCEHYINAIDIVQITVKFQ